MTVEDGRAGSGGRGPLGGGRSTLPAPRGARPRCSPAAPARAGAGPRPSCSSAARSDISAGEPSGRPTISRAGRRRQRSTPPVPTSRIPRPMKGAIAPAKRARSASSSARARPASRSTRPSASRRSPWASSPASRTASLADGAKQLLSARPRRLLPGGARDGQQYQPDGKERLHPHALYATRIGMRPGS